MSLLILATLLSDPQMSQIVLEGRTQETHIELSFRGKPTFQSFRSHRPNTLVVDVVGASLPAGFPRRVEIIKDVALHLDEHVGSRTRLMRLRLTLPQRLEPQLRASARAIHLTLPVGSTIARALGPAGATPQVEQALALRLQKRLKSLEVEHRSATMKLTDKEEQIERLSRRLRDALSKANQLGVDLRAKKQSYASSELARKRAEGRAQAALEAVQATQAQIRGEVDQLKSVEATKVQSNSQSLRELDARRTEIDELLREQERLKSKVAALDRVTQKQGRESERLIQTEVGLRADVESSTALLALKAQKLRHLNKRLGASESEIAALRKSQKSHARRIKRTAGLIVRRERDLNVINRERVALAKEVVAAKAKVDQRQVAVRKLDAEYVLVRDEVTKIDKRLKTVVSQRKGLARALKSKRGLLKKATVQIAEMEKEEKQALARTASLKRSIEKSDQDERKLLLRLASVRQSLEEKNKSLEALKRRLVPSAKKRKALAQQLKAERERVSAADAQVAELSAELSRRQEQLTKDQQQLARLQRQRRAQAKRATALAAKTKHTASQRAQTKSKLAAVKALPKPRVKPVLVAQAQPAEAKKRVSDAQDGAGFGGGPSVSTGRFERIGYRPVGPERVLIRFGGDAKVTLRKVGTTMTRVRLPGVSSPAKRLRALDTSLFGGLVQSIRPRRSRRGMTVELRHEEGIDFRIVRTVSGAELRIR